MLSSMTVALFPDSPHVILYGGPNDASGTVITGRVVVTSKHVEQLAALTVALRPQKTRIFQTQHTATPPINLQTVLIADGQMEPQAVHRDLGGNAREWQFSIGIPGSISETIYSKDCFVAYELVASARLAGSFASAAQSRRCAIAIKRTPPPDSLWSAVSSEPVSESAVWRSRLELTLIAESRIVYDQQALPVRGVIRPLEKGISLKRAGFQLMEHITHTAGMYGPMQQHTAKKVIVDNSIDMPSAADASCSTQFSAQAGLSLIQETSAARCLAVPQAYTGIQYDVHRDPIRASHELVLFVTIADAQGSTHNLRLATPVFVLPKVDARRTNLPRYEDAAADRLVSSGTTMPQRDSDFWSQYVLIDTVDTAEAADAAGTAGSTSSARASGSTPLVQEDTADAALDSCPLALEGYCASDDAQRPPPSYPGATSTIERTLVTREQTESALAAAETRRPIRRLCSRALLRAPPSLQLPPLPPPSLSAQTVHTASLSDNALTLV
ncbi:hypothetical protein H4R20_002256 [Coemansia guatemalensis]|uniref:Arrestin-like N-terminal domain-containing protein n=1 Tax=Coemansia guatemalensis TaxID=2761395 RepID=A0A9W8I466_9FUNG|nr:hypothetical protein H4R20_002256 [Coemansia guatemalensis]